MGKKKTHQYYFIWISSFLFRSCILEDNLCNWSYGTCSHANISRINDDRKDCITKQSFVECQCDRGYEIKKVNSWKSEYLPTFSLKNNDGSTSCVVTSNQTFDVMLNPRASFYLYHHGSISAVKFSNQLIII
jgi:hypothetical protein